jgi:hypothetical protein
VVNGRNASSALEARSAVHTFLTLAGTTSIPAG